MSTEQQLRTMKRDIEEIKDIISDQIPGGSNGIGDHVPSREEIQRMANHAGQSMRGFFRAKGEQLDTVRTRAEDNIKSRPMTSTAVALASGILVGALLRSKQ